MFAFGNKHPYHEVSIGCLIKTEKSLAVAFHDKRSYVLDGSIKPSFCGHMRSGVGIPYEIHTKSGKPVAEEMTAIVEKAISKTGNKITSLQTNAGQTTDAVLMELKNTQAERQFYISILEWKTDTYMKADLFCLVHLTMYDSKGETKVSTTVKASREGYGGSFWNPKKAARKGALKALKLKLEALFNDEAILKAVD